MWGQLKIWIHLLRPPVKKYKNNSLLVYLHRMMQHLSLFAALLSKAYPTGDKILSNE